MENESNNTTGPKSTKFKKIYIKINKALKIGICKIALYRITKYYSDINERKMH